MLTPTDIHYLVGLLTLTSSADRIEVELGALVEDPASGSARDVDVTVKAAEPGPVAEVFSGIEVKAHARPLDVTHVEQLCQKLNDMPALAKRGVVSASGYTTPAMRKAEKHGIDLFELVDANGRLEGFDHFAASSIPGSQNSGAWTGNVTVWVNPKNRVAEADRAACLANPALVTSAGDPLPNFPDLSSFIATQQLYAVQKLTGEVMKNRNESGGINARATITVADAFMKVPSGSIRLDELVFEGRLKWTITAISSAYRILRRCGDKKPIAGCCVFEWPGVGLVGLSVSNTNRDLQLIRIPISDRNRKKIFQQQLRSMDEGPCFEVSG